MTFMENNYTIEFYLDDSWKRVVRDDGSVAYTFKELKHAIETALVLMPMLRINATARILNQDGEEFWRLSSENAA